MAPHLMEGEEPLLFCFDMDVIYLVGILDFWGRYYLVPSNSNGVSPCAARSLVTF